MLFEVLECHPPLSVSTKGYSQGLLRLYHYCFRFSAIFIFLFDFPAIFFWLGFVRHFIAILFGLDLSAILFSLDLSAIFVLIWIFRHFIWFGFVRHFIWFGFVRHFCFDLDFPPFYLVWIC